MGAGVIPYCIHDDRLLFLFHRTFSGRRNGFLVDFGGGLKEGESYRQTAIRELIEETETMLFSDELAEAGRTPERIRAQIPMVEACFERTLSRLPDSYCRRAPGKKIPPKDWISYFIEIPYRDIAPLNQAWALDEQRQTGRFSKRRELFWIPADELLYLYRQTPEKLWKRVRQLQGAETLIRRILATPKPLIS